MALDLQSVYSPCLDFVSCTQVSLYFQYKKDSQRLHCYYCVYYVVFCRLSIFNLLVALMLALTGWQRLPGILLMHSYHPL